MWECGDACGRFLATDTRGTALAPEVGPVVPGGRPGTGHAPTGILGGNTPAQQIHIVPGKEGPCVFCGGMGHQTKCQIANAHVKAEVDGGGHSSTFLKRQNFSPALYIEWPNPDARPVVVRLTVRPIVVVTNLHQHLSLRDQSYPRDQCLQCHP